MSTPKILYSFHSQAEAEEIMTLGKVRLKTAIELGDPFEFKITDIARDWITKKVRQEKYRLYRTFKATLTAHRPGSYPFYGLSDAATEMLKAELKRIRGVDRRYSLIGDVVQRANQYRLPDPQKQFIEFDDQMDRFGILRLYERIDDSRLWSKYAGTDEVAIAHVVEPGSALADSTYSLRVQYTGSVPKFKGPRLEIIVPTETDGSTAHCRLAITDATLRTGLATKDIVHGHEREWRYIQTLAGWVKLPAPIHHCFLRQAT